MAMTLQRYRRIVAAGAFYDLVVSLPFATPWSAAPVLRSLVRLHGVLGLGGAPPPTFVAGHLLFVAFFGTVVTLWSLVRIVFRRPADGAADTIGRGFFAAWMAWAIAAGVSRLVAVAFALEIGWGLVQGVGYWRLREARASSSDAHR